MTQKWNKLPASEKYAAAAKLVLFMGILLCFALYFLQRWPDGKNISWLLFILHYFSDAFFLWKTRYDAAVRALCMGCFLALMFSPIALGYLIL